MERVVAAKLIQKAWRRYSIEADPCRDFESSMRRYSDDGDVLRMDLDEFLNKSWDDVFGKKD